MSKNYEETLLNHLKNYMKTAQKVKEIVKEIDPKAEVYVFGSTVRGKYTAASDIDILIVTNKIKEKYKIMVKTYKKVKAPIELHITTPKQFKTWYKKFINPKEITKIT